MKNMKISMKLITSFAIAIVLSILVGIIGIIGMSKINAADDALYNGNVIAFQALGDIRSAYLNMRIQLRNLVIFDYGTTEYNKSVSTIVSYEQRMQEFIKKYESTINDDIDRKNFDKYKEAYAEFNKLVKDTKEALAAGNIDEANSLVFTLGASIAEEATNSLLECVTYNDEIAYAAVNNNTKLFYTMLIIKIIVLVVSIFSAIFLVKYITGLISPPLIAVTRFMNKAAATGDISLTPEDIVNIEVYGTAKDETGQCVASTANFLKHITNISKELAVVAGGDLTTEIHVLSEEDVLGVSVQKMVDNLNNMFGKINHSTTQVSAGAKQIAEVSQNLSQASAEQSATVEQLSSSVSEISGQTKENAEMAARAAKLAEVIREGAEKSSRQMSEMMDAVQEINQASQNISNIIKVIDDIAFQTNILALNAAVEAARAGQNGKGFAVVAEEVRNLAAKSAEAAKNTDELIVNSKDKAELGVRIASLTFKSLQEIVKGINDSSQLLLEIAHSSENQSEAVTQIDRGIEQVAKVVQQNSATAEESAASSEEMNGQSDILRELVDRFRIKNTINL